MPQQTNTATTPPTVKDRLYTLYTELVEAEQDKKETAKAHSDNVKRIKSEIKDLLAEETEAVESVSRTE